MYIYVIKLVSMKKKQDIVKLRELLEKASEICSNNLEVGNIDMHSMLETLYDCIDKLNEIETFEVNGE